MSPIRGHSEPPPPPRTLSPTRVELHRAGRVTLHYFARVAGPERFILHVPRRHASSLLRHLRVDDTRVCARESTDASTSASPAYSAASSSSSSSCSRGSLAPTVTLPSPALAIPQQYDHLSAPTESDADGTHAGPLPHWLRRHVGRRVDLQYRPAEAAAREWALSGILLGLHPQPHAAPPQHRTPQPTHSSSSSSAARARRSRTRASQHYLGGAADGAGGALAPFSRAWLLFLRLDSGAVLARPVPLLSALSVRTDLDGRGGDTAAGTREDENEGVVDSDGDDDSAAIMRDVAHALAATVPDATSGVTSTIPVLVHTHAAGTGVLSLSYSTSSYTSASPPSSGTASRSSSPSPYSVAAGTHMPLFDFLYHVDATPVTCPDVSAPGSMNAGPVAAFAACTVQLTNPLPFVLRDVEVVLIDQDVRDDAPPGFTYDSRSTAAARRASSPPSLRPATGVVTANGSGPGGMYQHMRRYNNNNNNDSHSNSSRSDNSDGDGGGGGGIGGGARNGIGTMRYTSNSVSDDKDTFDYATIPIRHTTEGCYNRLPPFRRVLPGRLTLPVGQLRLVRLPSVPVELTQAEFVSDNNATAATVVCVTNPSDNESDVIESGRWSVRVSHGCAPFDYTEPALRPCKSFRLRVAEDSPVELSSAVFGRRKGEYVTGMLRHTLLTRVDRLRVVQMMLHNKDHLHKKRILLTSEYQTEPHLMGKVTMRLFRRNSVADNRQEKSECTPNEKEVTRCAHNGEVSEDVPNDAVGLQKVEAHDTPASTTIVSSVGAKSDDGVSGGPSLVETYETRQEVEAETRKQPSSRPEPVVVTVGSSENGNISSEASGQLAHVRNAGVGDINGSTERGEAGEGDVQGEEGKEEEGESDEDSDEHGPRAGRCTGDGRTEDKGQELAPVLDEPRGFLQYTFDLAPGERVLLCAQQRFATESSYHLGDGLPEGLLIRLRRSAVVETAFDTTVARLESSHPSAMRARFLSPPPLSRMTDPIVDQLRSVEALRVAHGDAYDRLVSLRGQVEAMRHGRARLGVDFSDDEDGEAADRYEAEVARMESRLARLRRMRAAAERRVVEAETELEDAIWHLHSLVHPELKPPWAALEEVVQE